MRLNFQGNCVGFPYSTIGVEVNTMGKFNYQFWEFCHGIKVAYIKWKFTSVQDNALGSYNNLWGQGHHNLIYDFWRGQNRHTNTHIYRVSH